MDAIRRIVKLTQLKVARNEASDASYKAIFERLSTNTIGIAANRPSLCLRGAPPRRWRRMTNST